MSRVWIVAAGRVRHPGLREAVEEYVERACRLGLPTRVVEVREQVAGGRRADPGAAMREQARRMLSVSLPARLWRVALDPAGQLLPGSEAFARWLERRLARAEVAFYVGGAWGLDPGLVERCDESLSLSPLTMAHELARVVLAEQVYRAATLLRGVRYHK